MLPRFATIAIAVTWFRKGFTQTSQCPPEDIMITRCLGPKDCLYPNPKGCNTFIQCTVDPGERTGTPVVMPCPAGLQWNDREKICDWPANATCPKKRRKSIRTSTGGYLGKRQGNILPCSVAEIADTGCKGPTGCLYPNPDNCNSFIHCTVNADNTTGTPVVMPCPSGLEWNDKKKECDYPSESTCGPEPAGSAGESTGRKSRRTQSSNPVLDPVQDVISCTSDLLKGKNCGQGTIGRECISAHPTDCRAYIMCSGGPVGQLVGQKVECPCGQVWDNGAEACVLPKGSIKCGPEECGAGD